MHLAEIGWKERWIHKATSVIFSLHEILYSSCYTAHLASLPAVWEQSALVLAVYCGSSAFSFNASLLTHDHTPGKSFCLVTDLLFSFFSFCIHDKLMLIDWPASVSFTMWLLPRLCCQNLMLGCR